MYEFICEYCGEVKKVEHPYEMGRFCSKSCAASYRNIRRSKSRNNQDVGECIFQPETIMCGKRKCDECGWNPVVAKARLDAIAENYNAEPMPEDLDIFGKWISVEERLPRDRVQVLTYTHTGKIMSLHCNDGKWCISSTIRITHWMPMPPKPEE